MNLPVLPRLSLMKFKLRLMKNRSNILGNVGKVGISFAFTHLSILSFTFCGQLNVSQLTIGLSYKLLWDPGRNKLLVSPCPLWGDEQDLGSGPKCAVGHPSLQRHKQTYGHPPESDLALMSL